MHARVNLFLPTYKGVFYLDWKVIPETPTSFGTDAGYHTLADYNIVQASFENHDARVGDMYYMVGACNHDVRASWRIELVCQVFSVCVVGVLLIVLTVVIAWGGFFVVSFYVLYGGAMRCSSLSAEWKHCVFDREPDLPEATM